ncbi:MAG: PAS domain S-box protein [Gammaproteobacteria bacterium]|nr:PAS domain S-box protein [Gammaproteobacteria bacterium]
MNAALANGAAQHSDEPYVDRPYFHKTYVVMSESTVIISSLTGLAIVLLLMLVWFYTENRRRRFAERALRTSRERFEAQFRGVPVPTFTWQWQSDDFRLVDYNNAAHVFTDGGIAELKGKTATDLYQQQRPDILADLRQCFEKKTNLHRHYWYSVLSTGVKRYVDVTYAYIPDDLVLIHTNDITEQKLAKDNLQHSHYELEQRVSQRTQELQKANAELTQEIARRNQAEQAMRREHEKVQSCIDNVNAIIVALDNRGNITLINQPACRLLERSQQDLIGKNWFDVCLIPTEKEEIFRVFQQIVLGKLDGADHFENKILTKSGRQRLIAWSNNIFYGPHGDIESILSVGEDITERRRAEEHVRTRQSEMARFARLTSMGELATGLAHELNQPLTAINVYAGSLVQQYRDGNEDKEKLYSTLERIAHQAQRAANIVHNLRQFISKGTTQHTPTDLNRLILQTTEIAIMDAKQANIKIDYNLSENLPMVTIDPIQIEQVLVNLLCNSLDAIMNNPVNDRHLSIQTTRPDGHDIQITISDNGPGIDGGDFEKLFQPLYTSKPDSMGMGLAISRSLIEAHEGRLSAANNPAGGATFTFTLPTEQNQND